jgi:hypothetical protein
LCYVTEDGVSFYQQPSRGTLLIGTAEKNTQIIVRDDVTMQNNWIPVYANGVEAWVLARECIIP